MSEERVGYIGRDDVPVGVALADILHIEDGQTFTALCNGQILTYRLTRERIYSEHGFMIQTLRICKRCEKKQGR